VLAQRESMSQRSLRHADFYQGISRAKNIPFSVAADAIAKYLKASKQPVH
jgi:hypothetical protein